MEQRLTCVTLGVADLDRARAFYAALGWSAQFDNGEVLFFQSGGMVFALWDRAKLAADSCVSDPGGWGGVTLAHNVRSREEVDATVTAAEAAGARVTKRPEETFYGGYAGCFTDLDGHVWEVAHNPGFRIAEDGSLKLPF